MQRGLRRAILFRPFIKSNLSPIRRKERRQSGLQAGFWGNGGSSESEKLRGCHLITTTSTTLTVIGEVRTVSKDGYGLMYRQADANKVSKPDNRRFISVSSEHFPEIQIRGWRLGCDLNTGKCWKLAQKRIRNDREPVCLEDPANLSDTDISIPLLQEWVAQYFRTIASQGQI